MGYFCCLHSIFEFKFFQQMALRESDWSKYFKYSQGGCCSKGLPQLSKCLIDIMQSIEFKKMQESQKKTTTERNIVNFKIFI